MNAITPVTIPDPMNDGYPPFWWFAGNFDDKIAQDPIAPHRISQVDDASNSGISVAQSTVAAQPRWDGVLNGKTITNWPGGATLNALNGPFQAFPTGFDYTFMFLVRSTLAYAGQRVITQRNVGNVLFDITVEPDGRVLLYNGTGNNGTNPGAVSANVPFLATFLMGLGAANASIRIDRITVKTGQTYAPTGAGGTFSVGRLGNSPVFQGLIADILVWKTRLPPHIVDNKEQYLQNKYATP